MKTVKYLILTVCLLVTGAVSASADWWVTGLSAGAQHVAGTSTLGPYPTQPAAQAANLQFLNGQGTVTGSDSPSGTGTAGGSYSSDPRVQAAGQIGNAVGNAIGQAIGKAILGDPQAQQAAKVATWNAGLDLNNQGIAYANQGKWKAAYDCFYAATLKCPGDANIEGNFEKAREELKREAREAKAKKDQETYDRLSKLLKQSESSSLGLKDLKMGDSNDDGGGGTVGVKGLPGIYLNDDTGKGSDKPYGIPGLPGIYVNGPGSGSSLAQPGAAKLPLMLGDDNTPPVQANNPVAQPTPATALLGMPQSQPTTAPVSAVVPASSGGPAGQANTEAVPGGPSPVVTPQTAAQPVAELQQQADASHAAAVATVPEDMSGIARAGFDTSLGPVEKQPVTVGTTGPSQPGGNAPQAQVGGPQGRAANQPVTQDGSGDTGLQYQQGAFGAREVTGIPGPEQTAPLLDSKVVDLRDRVTDTPRIPASPATKAAPCEEKHANSNTSGLCESLQKAIILALREGDIIAVRGRPPGACELDGVLPPKPTNDVLAAFNDSRRVVKGSGEIVNSDLDIAFIMHDGKAVDNETAISYGEGIALKYGHEVVTHGDLYNGREILKNEKALKVDTNEAVYVFTKPCGLEEVGPYWKMKGKYIGQ